MRLARLWRQHLQALWVSLWSSVISMIPGSTIWSTKNHHLFRGPVGQDMSEAGAGIRTRPSANTRSNITVLQYCRVPKNVGWTVPAKIVLIFHNSSQSRSYFSIRLRVTLVSLQRAHGRRRRMGGRGMRLKCFKPSKWSRFEVNNAAEEVVFTANAVWVWWDCSYSLGTFLFLDEIPAWPFFGKPFFGTRQYYIDSHDGQIDVCRLVAMVIWSWRSNVNVVNRGQNVPVGSTPTDTIGPRSRSRFIAEVRSCCTEMTKES